MSDNAKEILPVNIEEELKKSYLDYAMSVIVDALPDRQGMVWNRFTAAYYSR